MNLPTMIEYTVSTVRTESKRVPARRAGWLLLGLACNVPALAASFEFGPGIKGSFDTTVISSASVRVGGSNCAFIAQDNGGCASTGPVELASRDPANFSQSYDIARLNQDDGNLNYRSGQVFSATLRGLHELSLTHPSGWSGLIRANWIQEFSANSTERTPLSDDAQRQSVREFRFLDAYVGKEFEIAGLAGRIRAGNQVINWGESLFIPGGVGATNAIDVTKLHSPGAQLKEVQIPAPMVSMNLRLAKGLAVEAYAQTRWNASRLDPVGSFFSTSDVIGRGGQGVFLPTSLASSILSAYGLPPAPPGSAGDPGTRISAVDPVTGATTQRTYTAGELSSPATNPLYGPLVGTGSVFPALPDKTPSNSGQWGVALRHTDELSGDELAVYFLRYHDKLPNIGMTVDFGLGASPLLYGGMYADYATGRTVLGTSYNMRAGDWSVGLEASYRTRETVPIDPSVVINPANPYYCNGDLDPTHFLAQGTQCNGSVDRKKWQFDVSALHLLQPSGQLGGMLHATGAAEGSLLVELAVAHYPNLFEGAPVPFAVTNDYRMPTRTSSGMVGQLSLTYPNWINTGWTLAQDTTLSYGLSGISASSLPGFIQGAGAIGLGFTIDFRSRPATKFRLDLSHNFGGGLSNSLRDRDWVGLSLSSSF